MNLSAAEEAAARLLIYITAAGDAYTDRDGWHTDRLPKELIGASDVSVVDVTDALDSLGVDYTVGVVVRTTVSGRVVHYRVNVKPGQIAELIARVPSTRPLAEAAPPRDAGER